MQSRLIYAVNTLSHITAKGQGQKLRLQVLRYPLGVLISFGLFTQALKHTESLYSKSIYYKQIIKTSEVKSIAFRLKTANQNKENRWQRLTNCHAVPAMVAAILEGHVTKEGTRMRHMTR